MEKLISFDLEIAKQLPDQFDDWKKFSPLGISCMAFWDGLEFVEVHGIPQITGDRAGTMVDWMLTRQREGKKFLTWNGCSFDFHVLAQESQRWKECAELCGNHVDMMLIATINKGWYVGLDSALKAHRIASKQHRVQLRDGTFIEDMSGAMAPKMWAAGETQAVLDYLRGDVERPLELAESIQRIKMLAFESKNGKRHFVHVPKLWTVKEMMSMPMADNSWMDKPPTKRQFIEWMLPYLPFDETLLSPDTKQWA